MKPKLSQRELLRDEIIELKKQVKEKMKIWKQMDLDDETVNSTDNA